MFEIIETSQRSVLPQLSFNTGQENVDVSFYYYYYYYYYYYLLQLGCYPVAVVVLLV